MPSSSAIIAMSIYAVNYYIVQRFKQFKFKIKWDVQLWGFGSLFLNSLMHCLAERHAPPPKKIKLFLHIQASF
jgi:hypothetical protein